MSTRLSPASPSDGGCRMNATLGDTSMRIAELERENAKLRKINAVLIDRVERNMDFQGNAYSLFQTATVLEDQIRERTAQLENTLRELESTNRALNRAKEVAETAKLHLVEAIESISEGFLLCDAQDRIVMVNSKYRDLWLGLVDVIHPGAPFIEVLQRSRELQLLDGDDSPVAHGVARRWQYHLRPDGVLILKLRDGRWIQVNERRTADGGSVAIYADITEIKLSEQKLREQELATKNALLQAIFDNISQGILVFNRDGCLVARNQGVLDLLQLSADNLEVGRSFRDVIDLPEIAGRLAGTAVKDLAEPAETTCIEKLCDDGRILEIRLGPMPDGGIVSTYADITERRRSAEEIREAKETLERRVAERTTELTAVNLQLKQEIEERRQAEEALQSAKAEAEQANMSKTKFIAGASHDLLQPLNAARVFAETLAASRMAPRNQGLVANLSLALISVEELLSTLLDISKLDAGALTPEICDFRLDDIIRALAVETAPQARAGGLVLRWVGCSAVVRSDPLLITRIIRNFLSNAIRYTADGTILMGCRRRPDGIEFQILDTGIGIPAEKLDMIFEEFHRLNVDLHGSDRGVGLGLAIVERIARLLGHRIVVHSNPGRGSTFGVLLPPGEPNCLRPHEPTVEPAIRLDRLNGLRVMVIENDASERVAMHALLQSWKCEVTVAGTADAALNQLQALEDPPDVVVADYHLDTGETGLQALSAVHAALRRPVHGIILTADRTQEIHYAVREAGYQILNKPLKPARLRSLLAHHVDRQRRQSS